MIKQFIPEFKAQYGNLFDVYAQKMGEGPFEVPAIPPEEMSDDELILLIAQSATELALALKLYGRERPEVEPPPPADDPEEESPE